MSDFNSDPQVPPPPPPAAPAPPAPGYAPPPGYGTYPQVAAKPPRPAVPIGAWLLVAGGALMIIGSVLNWYSLGGEKFNGFTEALNSDGEMQSNDGPVFTFLAVLSIGFGIAQLAAKRVLAVAILAVIFATFGMLAAIVDVGDLGDLEDLWGQAYEGGSGLYVVLLGSIVALAGGIVTLAKRRR